jgi:glycosyltransferase involved in cell wall biosynthesis
MAMGARRIAIVAPGGEALRSMEGALAEIGARGHRMLAVAPQFSGADIGMLDEFGVERAALSAESHMLKLYGDWKAISALKAVLAGWEPHVVLGCGARTMVYAALAAKSAGVERVVLLFGALPALRFAGELGPDEIPAWRYTQALGAADEAVFQNRDDLALLQRLGIVPPHLPTAVVPPSIDLARRAPLPLPPASQGLVFLMMAPIDKRKGVIEYCEAAREVRARAPNTRFLLAGPPGEGPQAIGQVALAALGSAVEFLGPGENVEALLGQCHVFVYPSHAEAMPRPVLEAMAAGRPIITTNVAGCRETVDERVNGCLVEPRSPHVLAAAMESFLKRPDLIAPIARASRAKVERLCGGETVNGALLSALALA